MNPTRERRLEMALEDARVIAEACEQEFQAMNMYMPKSKRGSNYQGAFDRLRERLAGLAEAVQPVSEGE